MINISTDRKFFIITPDMPQGTEEVYYEVYVDGSLVFTGKSGNFGGRFDYEVDVTDFVEAQLAKTPALNPARVQVVVDFYYDDPDRTNPDTYSMAWAPEVINLPSNWSSGAWIQLANCGFTLNQGMAVEIPLMVRNGLVEGKTINKLTKVKHMDRYGDEYNSSVSNRYEIECYIDPSWLKVTTRNDLEYAKLELAMQNALTSWLILSKGVDISGIKPANSALSMKGRVKDVEKVETQSSYSVSEKVPTYKITFELYR